MIEVGSLENGEFTGLRMFVTPQLIPDSPVIRLQHAVSIGREPNHDQSLMSESLVGSGQTLILLIERQRPDDGNESVDRYVLLLTPEHIQVEEIEAHVPQSDQQ